jgi:FimV-like protein
LLTVPVGARADWGQASLAARPLSANTADTANDYGPVKRGETLSQIAESLLGDDVTLNQMMLALYDTNQDAFDGNINVLREGAMLSVPDTSVLHRQAPVMAAAEVVRHTNEWRGSVAPEIQPSVIPEPEAYGPVARGETLSGIAASLSRNGATINQMMVALFEANPLAFDDNINLLKEGAVLQIPDESALHRNSYETATAAVVRHMETHKPAASQPPQPFVVADDLVTMLDRRLHLPGAILF